MAMLRLQDLKNIFERTGCDAVMIGRGAEGNPWIFPPFLNFYLLVFNPGEPRHLMKENRLF